MRQIPRHWVIEGVKRASPLRRVGPSTLRPIRYRRFSQTWGCYPFLRRAEQAGYGAIVVTLDTGLFAWRERDLQNAFMSDVSGWAAAYILNLLSRNKRFLIYSIQMLKRREPDWFRQDLTTLLGLLERGELKPVIDRRLPLEQAALAEELLGKGETVGKIVLVSE